MRWTYNWTSNLRRINEKVPIQELRAARSGVSGDAREDDPWRDGDPCTLQDDTWELEQERGVTPWDSKEWRRTKWIESENVTSREDDRDDEQRSGRGAGVRKEKLDAQARVLEYPVEQERTRWHTLMDRSGCKHCVRGQWRGVTCRRAADELSGDTTDCRRAYAVCLRSTECPWTLSRSPNMSSIAAQEQCKKFVDDVHHAGDEVSACVWWGIFFSSAVFSPLPTWFQASSTAHSSFESRSWKTAADHK